MNNQEFVNILGFANNESLLFAISQDWISLEITNNRSYLMFLKSFLLREKSVIDSVLSILGVQTPEELQIVAKIVIKEKFSIFLETVSLDILKSTLNPNWKKDDILFKEDDLEKIVPLPTRLSFEQIEAIHKILGDGNMSACYSNFKQCNGSCCGMGAPLLPGEKEYLLRKVPEQIRLSRKKIINCLGQNGCLLPGDIKPIVCKLFPLVSDNRGNIFLDASPGIGCFSLAQISQDVVRKIEVVKNMLKKLFKGDFIPAPYHPFSNANSSNFFWLKK